MCCFPKTEERETVQVKTETDREETWSSSNMEILIIVFGPVASENSVPINRSFLYENNSSNNTQQDKHDERKNIIWTFAHEVHIRD